MKLLERLNFRAGLLHTGDENKLSLEEVFSHRVGDDSTFLCVDGKITHRLDELPNKNPKDIHEIDTKVLVLIPLSPWYKICQNAKIFKTRTVQMCDPVGNGNSVPTDLVLYSQPYENAQGRDESFKGLVTKINEHMEKNLKLITEANKDLGNDRQ